MYTHTIKTISIINASPRPQGNTSRLCQRFAQGAESLGVHVETIHLYDLQFHGCRSCFACKLRKGRHYGHCAYPDDLAPELHRITQGDGLVLATPIYFGDVAGIMKSFIERLFFPFTTYDEHYTPIPPRKLKTAVIYTMNMDERTFFPSYLGEQGDGPIGFFERWITHVYEQPERLCAFNTYQFKDYRKYVADRWDVDDKERQRQEVFPLDLQHAEEAGRRMAQSLLP